MSCHASTLAVSPCGDLLCAWFEGGAEGRWDTVVRLSAGGSEPVTVADVGPVAHWNPVLFAPPGGDVHLFFKVGERPDTWRTWWTTSVDGGRTWPPPRELTGHGPVKNKSIVLADGTWLAPASREDGPWRCFVDASRDGGTTWEAAPVPGDGVIQPALWESEPGAVHVLMRSTHGRVMRSDSADGGRTWCPAYATDLPNNNSGIDLERLGDGTLALACNPVDRTWGPRTPLVVLTSGDNGATWREVAVLEDEPPPAEFSYPSVVRYGDGVAVSYTWKRERIAVALLEQP